EPSVSGLIVAIAQQQLAVGEPFTLNSNQVNALQQAIKALQDGGHIGEAQIVLALLLNQGKLETPLRQSLMKQLSQPTEGWRIQIEDFMARKQPFCLLYRNSQNQELEFTVRYAEIPFYEKRFYLQVWCEETKDVADENPDLPELWHNRCLRFDNIQSVLPINGEWRGELDSIKVYLQFRGWLAKAYEVKEEDLENQLRGEVRYVVRRVVNPFWLIREVSRYWEDCIIVAPDSIRDRVKQKLKSLCQNYNIEIRD
ncbi:MAG TPA: transcriptional regulator, partial [Cyanobacteria bacterium UBA11166]|nr:transcriptional regulator [Cyanobacteria bacterium UBA11166]